MESLRSSCERVLRSNDRGAFTVPSPKLYPHQWAWDSAFCAIGWVHIDPARAWTELDTLMSSQWPDGRIPHVRYHDKHGDYFPGPDFWETEESSSITQPPLWATAARVLFEVTGDRARLERLIEPMDRSHRFFHASRDPNGLGLVAVVHPWESGLDNCPAWDGPLARVSTALAPGFERRDTAIVADPEMRPTDDDYLRYAALVKAIAADGFGPGPFAVYDPMMTAALARAELDLAHLCDQLERPTEARTRGERLQEALVAHLWREDLGRFLYVDAHTGEEIGHDVIGGYLPLWCGLPEAIDAKLREGLATRFTARWPLPSTSPADPAFESRRYWRGPTWINVNWMLSRSLGPGFAEQTIELVRKHGFREYYDPATGEGLGAEQFSWTAALTLDLLERPVG